MRQRYAPEISFRRWFDPGLRAELATSTRDELETWLRDHERWLLPDPEHPHQLQVAEWLRPLGVSAGAPEFLSIAPDLAATELGVSRLRRLFPTAPPMTTRAEWQTFLRKHGNALFFTESGHVWLVDPLAVARRVPSCQLRGPDRRDPTES